MKRGQLLGLGLVIGDLICLSAFAVVGLHSHEEALTLHSFARAAGSFEVAWLAFAIALDLFSVEALTPPSRVWRRVLEAWLPAWLIGLLLRSLLFDRPLVLAFAIVSLVFNGVGLVLWRTALAFFLRTRAPVESP